jgi:hypothetical protein
MIQYGIIRADLPALKAADAEVFIENQLRRWFVGLGILAPGAGQRTAFKKNGCADARAIMKRKPLDIKYCGAGCRIGDPVIFMHYIKLLQRILDNGHC